jgi:hypothetical protein
MLMLCCSVAVSWVDAHPQLMPTRTTTRNQRVDLLPASSIIGFLPDGPSGLMKTENPPAGAIGTEGDLDGFVSYSTQTNGIS